VNHRDVKIMINEVMAILGDQHAGNVGAQLGFCLIFYSLGPVEFDTLRAIHGGNEPIRIRRCAERPRELSMHVSVSVCAKAGMSVGTVHRGGDERRFGAGARTRGKWCWGDVGVHERGDGRW
jgi:hypothetical protein